MAQDAIIPLAMDTWTQITSADSTSITVIHRGGAQVIIQATTGASPEDDDRRGLPLLTGDDRHVVGFIKKPIVDLSHVADVDRVWAFAIDEAATLYVQADA